MPLSTTLRKANYRFHKWAGCFCALFLIVVGSTGAVLVFEKEISTALHPDWHQVFTSGRDSLPLDDIDRKLRAQFPEHQIAGYWLPRAENDSLKAQLMRDGIFSTAYINPASGEILGHSTPAWRRIVLKIHHDLVFGQWGAALLFCVACGMVLLGLSGLWMQRKILKNLFRRPRFSRSPRLGFTDLHKMLGIPAFLFLLVSGSTGALYNFPAFGKIAAGKAGSPGFRSEHRHHQAASTSLDAALRRAQKSIPDFTPSYLSYPKNGNGKIGVFGVTPGQEFFGGYTSGVTLDASTGDVLSRKDFREQPWSKKWRAFIRPLHYGNFGGLFVKTLYSLAALSIVALSITGLRIRKSRKKRHLPANEKSPDRKVR